MKLKQRIVISITFVNGDAVEVIKGYEALGKTHREIYLAGLKALKK